MPHTEEPLLKRKAGGLIGRPEEVGRLQVTEMPLRGSHSGTQPEKQK